MILKWYHNGVYMWFNGNLSCPVSDWTSWCIWIDGQILVSLFFQHQRRRFEWWSRLCIVVVESMKGASKVWQRWPQLFFKLEITSNDLVYILIWKVYSMFLCYLLDHLDTRMLRFNAYGRFDVYHYCLQIFFTLKLF